MRLSDRAALEALIYSVRAHGWAMAASGLPAMPRYVYTAGLTLYGPAARELVVCGLENLTAATLLLEELARLVRDGDLDAEAGYPAGELFTHALRFRPVHASWRRQAFGRGMDVVKELGAPAPPEWLQVVYPDKEGRWPGEAGCAAGVAGVQPDLSAPYPEEETAPAGT